MITLSARDILNAADLLNHTPVAALALQPITENTLIRNGILTLADLARVDIDRVLGIGIYGEVAIRTAMERKGFTLAHSTLGLTTAQEADIERSAA